MLGRDWTSPCRSLQRGYDHVGVEQKLPLAGIDPLTAFFNRVRHLPGRNGVERG
jgi:hypothetical protein